MSYFPELHLIHREIGLLRDENRYQNQEIEMLKEIMGLQNHQMREEITPQRKRPARLLPLQLLFRPKNETDYIPIRRFYGPPTNCSELSELGYTLNGFYWVKAHQTENNGTTKDGDKMQVEVIYCTFRHPEGIYNRTNVIEKKASVSYLNSKPTNDEANSGIHFRARLTSDLEATKSTNILFDTIRLNHGGVSYNEKTGHFTIPKTGIYQITFSGLIRGSTSAKPSNYPTSLSILVNDAHQGWFESITIIDSNQYSNQVLLATMKLHQRDTISISIEVIGNGKKFELKSSASLSCSLLKIIG